MDRYVVVIGGINIDIKGKACGRLVGGSSNPGLVRTSAGGVGRNIAHNLALMGIPVKLLSAVGAKDEGRELLNELSDAGVSTEHILCAGGHHTGTYLAILDHSGEMELALSDMSILDKVDAGYLESRLDIIRDAAFLVCDTNIPAESIRFVKACAAKSGIPLGVEPVSVAKAAKLRDQLDGITYITPNADELAAICGTDPAVSGVPHMAELLVSRGVKNVITTLGEKGLCHTGKNGSVSYESFSTEVADVTGAGDSLTAGFIYGLYRYGSEELACRYGLAAAAITVNSKATVSEKMSVGTLEAVLKNGGL